MIEYSMYDLIHSDDKLENDFTRDPDNVVFRNIVFQQSMRLRECVTERCYMVFITKGRVLFKYKEHEYDISCGHFFFIPAGHFLSGESLEETEMFVLCAPVSFKPSNYLVGVDPVLVSKLGSKPHTFTIFDIKEPLKLLLDLAIDLIKKGENTREFHEQMRKSLALVIRDFYNLEDIVTLFQSVLSSDLAFKAKVETCWAKNMTSKEIVVNCNMSKSLFYKKFKAEFNMPLNKWIQHQKAIQIYELIGDKNLRLKDIMLRFSFISQSEFNRFCRRMFNMSPTQLRKKILAEQAIKISVM